MSAHTAKVSMEDVRNMFPGPQNHQTCPPVIFPCGGYLKERLCLQTHTLIKLKDAITDVVHLIERELLAWVMHNFWPRIEICIEEDGRHLSDIIFHT